MIRKNTISAFLSSNGIMLYMSDPYIVVNVVFGQSSLVIWTW